MSSRHFLFPTTFDMLNTYPMLYSIQAAMFLCLATRSVRARSTLSVCSGTTFDSWTTIKDSSAAEISVSLTVVLPTVSSFFTDDHTDGDDPAASIEELA